MKCAVCGKEFGTNNKCQHCGADKVTGLGNYNGYEAPVRGAYNNSSTASAPQPKIVTVDSMVCHACGEIIPASSKFCPHCSHSLWVQCPKCGKTYSSQYPACSECGTNRKEYIEKQQQEKRKQEMERRRYEEWLNNTPEGQAEQERIKKNQERADRESCLKVLSYTISLFGLSQLLAIFFLSGVLNVGEPPIFMTVITIASLVVGLALYVGSAYLAPDD